MPLEETHSTGGGKPSSAAGKSSSWTYGESTDRCKPEGGERKRKGSDGSDTDARKLSALTKRLLKIWSALSLILLRTILKAAHQKKMILKIKIVTLL